MTLPVATVRTSTHEFYIWASRSAPGSFEVDYKPLNPKTGAPWQAHRYVRTKADVTPERTQYAYWTSPVAYSTLEKAHAALVAQRDKLAKQRRSK